MRIKALKVFIFVIVIVFAIIIGKKYHHLLKQNKNTT